jgi:protein-S-isoprenylcysteine O-methyltransferase Ste14
MPNLYVVPCTAALLAVARIVEFRIRGASAKSPVVAPTSFAAITAAGFLVVGVGFIEYFVRKPAFSFVVFPIGLVTVLAGFVLRAVAARELGDLWSVHIEIRPKHRLVTTGPYHWIRHPIYASLLIELLGGTLLLHAPLSTCTFFALYLPVVVWRLRVEERAMIDHFGDAYRDYMSRVPALIPNPWRHAT